MSCHELMAFITGCREPEHYCHVLIDPLAVPEQSDLSLLDQLRGGLGEDALTRVLRTDLPQAPHLHPLLIRLAGPGDALSPSLLEVTARAAIMDLRRRKRHVCGWLLSDSPASTIAAHLTSICQIPSASGGEEFHPVFEPIRLELFASAFARVDDGPWWPINRWLFLTSGGVPASITGRQAPRNPVPARARDVQNDASLIETVLNAWKAMLACASSNPPPPLLELAAIRASEAIRQARILGLTSPDDIQTFALHLLCIHPRLHTHPDVLALISSAIQQQHPLASLFAQYTDGNWRYVTSHLPGAEARP